MVEFEVLEFGEVGEVSGYSGNTACGRVGGLWSWGRQGVGRVCAANVRKSLERVFLFRENGEEARMACHRMAM